MEVIKSKDFHEDSAEAALFLKAAGDRIDPKLKQELEIQIARDKVLQKVEAVAGTDSNVFSSNDSADANVAGFCDKGKSHLNVNTLRDVNTLNNNEKWAIHVNSHENLHPLVLSNVEINKYLSQDHAAPIVKALQKELDDVNWVEGFTELINIMENEEHPRCAYNKLEVPAARELERLCMEHTGQSLMEAFKTKNVGLFYYRLRKLADCMLLNEVADEMEDKMGEKSSNIIDIRELVTERLKHGHVSVQSKKDAQRVVGKILQEEAAIESIKMKLAA